MPEDAGFRGLHRKAAGGGAERPEDANGRAKTQAAGAGSDRFLDGEMGQTPLRPTDAPISSTGSRVLAFLGTQKIDQVVWVVLVGHNGRPTSVPGTEQGPDRGPDARTFTEGTG